MPDSEAEPPESSDATPLHDGEALHGGCITKAMETLTKSKFGRPMIACDYRSDTSLLAEDAKPFFRNYITIASRAKLDELPYHGVDCHDFQVDADLRRAETHTSDELIKMRDRQRCKANEYLAWHKQRHEKKQ